MKLETTLNAIRDLKPCAYGWETLLRGLGKTKADDKPLHLLEILEINGIADALWCLRCWPEYSLWWQLLAARFARDVWHLMFDERSRRAVEAAEMHSFGQETDEELFALMISAKHAAWDAAAVAGILPGVHAARAASSAAGCDAKAAARSARSTGAVSEYVQAKTLRDMIAEMERCGTGRPTREAA